MDQSQCNHYFRCIMKYIFIFLILSISYLKASAQALPHSEQQMVSLMKSEDVGITLLALTGPEVFTEIWRVWPV